MSAPPALDTEDKVVIDTRTEALSPQNPANKNWRGDYIYDVDHIKVGFIQWKCTTFGIVT